jgi:hypothetical protein
MMLSPPSLSRGALATKHDSRGEYATGKLPIHRGNQATVHKLLHDVAQSSSSKTPRQDYRVLKIVSKSIQALHRMLTY